MPKPCVPASIAKRASISRLRHPNIVTIFEYGDHQGQPFIVMEYIAGESMDELIQRRASLPLVRKLEMMEQLCAGMAYAHRARIVHRDLKPPNLMIDDETGSLKILDFGIARHVETGTARHTDMIGTPAYMSPEQGGGKTLDHRSDIFSVGCVFYELLSYRLAFHGESAMVVFNMIANREPAALEGLCPDLDPALIAIVDKALRKHPSERYQDLERMRVDIARVRERLQAAAPKLMHRPQTSAHTQTNPVESDSLPQQRSSQIDQHFQAAAAAFQADDFDRAIEWCRQVLMFDAGNAAALGLIDRARAARDQQVVDEHVSQARQFAAEGAITQAEKALAEALKRRGTDRGARALQRELQHVRQETERTRHRADAAASAIGRARARIDAKAFDAAARAASEALAYDPDSAEARALVAEALEAVERQRQDERSRRAAEPTSPGLTGAPTEKQDDDTPGRAARPRLTRWVVVGGTVAAIAVGGLLLRRDTPPPIEAPASVAPATPPVAVPPPPAASPPEPVSSAPPRPAQPAPASDDAERDRILRDARALLDQKRYAEAVRMYQRIAAQRPTDQRVLSALALARLTDGRQSELAKEVSRRADQAMAAREYDSAIRLYQNAVDAYPDAPDAVSRLNEAKAAKARAENVLTEVLGSRASTKPGLSDQERSKLFDQAEALISARLFDPAIAIYDQILAAEPDNATARQGKARVLNLKAPKQ